MSKFDPNNTYMPDLKTEQVQRDPRVPWMIWAPAKVLSWISPVWAARFAAWLFCTPIRFKMPKRELDMNRDSRQEVLIVPAIRKKIVVYHYGNSSKKILLVHGWSGRGTQLSVIADRLLQEGYSTVSFDAPAHGKSPGKRTQMLEFIESCLFLSRTFGPFTFGIGHSLGAMTLLQSTYRGAGFEKLVLIGSGNMVPDIMNDFIAKLGLPSNISTLMKRYFDEISGMDTQNLSAEIVTPEIQVPVLVIHDTKDHDVPVSAAYRIHQSLPKAELLITEGLGHRKILRDHIVMETMMKFLIKHP